MKPQGRGDSSGRIPPPHDDYDDYDDVEFSAEDDLEASGLVDDYEDEPIEAPTPARHAGARPGSNGNRRAAPGNGRPSAPQGSHVSPVRPPSGVAGPPAANLPKRRHRPDAPQAQVEVEAPPTVAPARPTGNGKRKGPNGIAATATVATPAATTAPAPRTSFRVPQSEAGIEAPPQPESFATRFSRFIVNYETLIYMGIFLVALITRFWDLGNRGIHHDESLHAVFSRNLYVGSGYTHDPMMHGPIQFNLIAAMYWL
ncbi:MAG: hypothetical protein WCD37_03930, partial [Chloroflexia bacterium]